MDARVSCLEKNIGFLQTQHREALETLHGEIDRLNRENKELQYKLIMEPPKSSCEASRCGIQSHAESNTFQVDRVNNLQQNLEYHYPLNRLTSSQIKYQESTSHPSRTLKRRSLECAADVKAGFITSLQPLMIQFSPSQVPRPATLYECEVLIRQLYSANSLQSQEIMHLKAVLKDIVYMKKISAENFILIKPYLDCKRAEDSEKLPNLSPQSFPRGQPMTQSSKTEKVILPALKQSRNNVAERHRRIQAVQRHRLQRSLR